MLPIRQKKSSECYLIVRKIVRKKVRKKLTIFLTIFLTFSHCFFQQK